MELSVDQLRSTLQSFIAASSEDVLDTVKQQLSTELGSAQALLRDPVTRRPRDPAARQRLQVDGFSAELINLVCQLADDLGVHEDDAREVVLSSSDPNLLPDDPHFFPPGLAPFSRSKRLFLYRRHSAIAALEELFAALQDERVVCNAAKRTFLCREVSEALLRPRAGSPALPAVAMEGIRRLTAEATGGADAFHHSACIADRTRLARCLFHLYDAASVSLHSGGNALLLRAARQSGGGGSAAPPEVDGGDLLGLIALLHWCGEKVWSCVDHSDSNPLWEVTGTLLVALAAALYPRGERFDPFDGTRGNFHPLLVRATQLVVAQHAVTSATTSVGAGSVPLDARLWAAAGLHLAVGAHQPVSWHCSGLQAAVLLLMGLWHFAAFRGEPSDIARDLQELQDDADASGLGEDVDVNGDAAAEAFAFGTDARSGPASGGDAGRGAVNATVAGILRRWPVRSTTIGGTEESLDQLQAFMLGALRQGMKDRGVSMMSRIISGAAFRCSPVRTRAVPLLHDVVSELLRCDITMVSAADKHILLRTRLWHKRQFALRQRHRHHQSHHLQQQQQQAGLSFSALRAAASFSTRGGAATGADESLQLAPHEDCLEEVLLLQAVLLRALPELACRYVCLAGAAASPYQPKYDASWPSTAFTSEGRSSIDIGTLIPPFDDGVGIAVRSSVKPGASGPVGRLSLDPLSYLKIIGTLLDRDAQLDSRGEAASGYNRGTAAEVLDDQVLPSAPRDATDSPVHDVRVLTARVLGLLAAVASGPLAADGRSCADHILAFLHPQYASDRELRSATASSAAAQNGGGYGAALHEGELDTSGLGTFRQGGGVQHVASIPTSMSAYGCPAHVQLASLLASLALTTTACDPEHSALREAAFAAARDFHEQQAASALAAERSLAAVPLVDVYSLGGYDYGPMDDVIDPSTVHPTPDSLLVPQLRLLVTLCAHPYVRDIVLRLHVPKPRAWTAAEHFRRKQQLDGGGGFPATVQFYGQQRAAWDLQTDEAARPVIEPLQLAFLCLRLPMSLAVKAQLIAFAAAVAAAGADYACEVRDLMEATQVLQTGGGGAALEAANDALAAFAPAFGTGFASSSFVQRRGATPARLARAPSSSGSFGLLSGLRNELEAVETPEKNYECTIAFCALLRVLLSYGPTKVPLHTLGAGTRVAGAPPGIGQHVRFVIDAVLLPARSRPVANGADRFRVIAAALGVLYDCVRFYSVVFPAPALPLRHVGGVAAASVVATQQQWVAGDPTWDFLDPALLPAELAVGNGFSAGTAPPPRSPGFDVLRSLLASSHAGPSNGGGGSPGSTSASLLSLVIGVLGPPPGDAAAAAARARSAAAAAGVTVGVLALPLVTGHHNHVSDDTTLGGSVSALETEVVARTDSASSAAVAERTFVVNRARERIDALKRAAKRSTGDSGSGDTTSAGDSLAWMAETSREEATALAVTAGGAELADALKLTPEQSRDIERETDAAALVFCEAAASGQQGGCGGRGVCSTGADEVRWRERCLLLSCSLLDAVLARDTAFLGACQSSLATSPVLGLDTLTPMAELLRRHRAIPMIAQLAAYRWDTRLGLVAARLLYRLACNSSPSSMTPTVAASSLVRELESCGAAACGDLMARMAQCISAGGADGVVGTEEEDERDAVAGLRSLSRLRALAAIGGRPLRTVAAASRPRALAAALAAAATPALDLLLQGKPAASVSASVVAAGVPLPLLAADAPSVMPAALATALCGAHEVADAVIPSLSRYPVPALSGWASDTEVLARTDQRAASVRRGTLMSLVLGCLQQVLPAPPHVAPLGSLRGADDDPRGNSPLAADPGLGFLAPVASLGHWLLGLKHATVRSRQGPLVTAPSVSGQGQYAIPRPGDVTCLHAVVSLLGVYGIAERRPTVAQQAAAIVHELLASAATRRCTLAFLQHWQQNMAGEEPDHMRWSVARLASFALCPGLVLPPKVDVGLPDATDVLEATEALLQRVTDADHGSISTGVHFSGSPLSMSGIGAASSSAPLSLSAQLQSPRIGSVLVPAAIRRSVAYRQTLTYFLRCVAIDLHTLACLPASQAAAADAALSLAQALLEPRPHSAQGGYSLLISVLKELPLALQRPLDPPQALRTALESLVASASAAAVEPSAGFLSSSHAPASTSRAVPTPRAQTASRFATSATPLQQAAAATTENSGRLLVGAVGVLLGLPGGTAFQCYDPAVAQALVAAAGASDTAAAAGSSALLAVSTASVALFSSSFFSRSGASTTGVVPGTDTLRSTEGATGAEAQPITSFESAQAVATQWAKAHNSFGVLLQSGAAVCAAWSDLTALLVNHMLPAVVTRHQSSPRSSSVSPGSFLSDMLPPVPDDAQAVVLSTLWALSESTLVALNIAAGAEGSTAVAAALNRVLDASAPAPGRAPCVLEPLLALPLVQLLPLLFARTRALCPSVRLSGSQTTTLVRALVALGSSFSQDAPSPSHVPWAAPLGAIVDRDAGGGSSGGATGGGDIRDTATPRRPLHVGATPKRFAGGNNRPTAPSNGSHPSSFADGTVSAAAAVRALCYTALLHVWNASFVDHTLPAEPVLRSTSSAASAVAPRDVTAGGYTMPMPPVPSIPLTLPLAQPQQLQLALLRDATPAVTPRVNSPPSAAVVADCAAGCATGLLEAGSALVTMMVRDAAEAEAGPRSTALLTLATLLSPPHHGPSLGVAAAERSPLPVDTLVQLARLRSGCLRRLDATGALRQLVVSLTDVDDVENSTIESVRVRLLAASAQARLADDSSVHGAHAISAFDPSTGRKRLRLAAAAGGGGFGGWDSIGVAGHWDGGASSGLAAGAADPSGYLGGIALSSSGLGGDSSDEPHSLSEVASLRACVDNALAVFAAIAAMPLQPGGGSNDGSVGLAAASALPSGSFVGARLLDAKLLPALSRSRWLERAKQSLSGQRALPSGAVKTFTQAQAEQQGSRKGGSSSCCSAPEAWDAAVLACLDDAVIAESLPLAQGPAALAASGPAPLLPPVVAHVHALSHRLLPLLHALLSWLRDRKDNAELSGAVWAWVSQQQVVVDAVVAAVTSQAVTTRACLQVARALVDVLAQLAACGAQGPAGAMEASRADALVLRIFARFAAASGPAAGRLVRAAAAATNGAVVAGAARKGGGDGSGLTVLPASAEDVAAAALPSRLLACPGDGSSGGGSAAGRGGGERPVAWQQRARDPAVAARLGRMLPTQGGAAQPVLPPWASSAVGGGGGLSLFDDTAALDELGVAASASDYLRVRGAPAILLASAGPAAAASAPLPPLLFRAPVDGALSLGGHAWDAHGLPVASAPSAAGSAAAAAASGSGTPSINLLLDALEQAAAGRHAAVELCRRSPAPAPAALAAAAAAAPALSPPLDVGAAAMAYSLCVHTFESLLAVWLAHAAMDAGLRFEAADVAAFGRKGPIAAALDASPFAEAVFRQLRALGS